MILMKNYYFLLTITGLKFIVSFHSSQFITQSKVQSPKDQAEQQPTEGTEQTIQVMSIFHWWLMINCIIWFTNIFIHTEQNDIWTYNNIDNIWQPWYFDIHFDLEPSDLYWLSKCFLNVKIFTIEVLFLDKRYFLFLGTNSSENKQEKILNSNKLFFISFTKLKMC